MYISALDITKKRQRSLQQKGVTEHNLEWNYNLREYYFQVSYIRYFIYERKVNDQLKIENTFLKFFSIQVFNTFNYPYRTMKYKWKYI